MRKILIVGTSGCGKTTLGKTLSAQLDCPYVDLDDLYWLPNWKKQERSAYLRAIQEVMQKESWIMCGNTWQPIWPEADTVIWLDVSLPRLLWRSLKRTVRRIRNREPCCNGNYESLTRLCGKNSIVMWILRSYRRRKKVYTELFSTTSEKDLYWLKTQKEIETFARDRTRTYTPYGTRT